MTAIKRNRQSAGSTGDSRHPVTLEEWQDWCHMINEGYCEAVYNPNAKDPKDILKLKPGADVVVFMVESKDPKCTWPCGHFVRRIHYRAFGTDAYILRNWQRAKKYYTECGMGEDDLRALFDRIKLVANAKDKAFKDRYGPITREEEVRCHAFLRSINIDLSVMGDDGRAMR